MKQVLNIDYNNPRWSNEHDSLAICRAKRRGRDLRESAKHSRVGGCVQSKRRGRVSRVESKEGGGGGGGVGGGLQE